MRFVIGLIFGAGLILVAAQQPDARWLREAPAWLDRLADAAGDALALPPRPAGEAGGHGDVGLPSADEAVAADDALAAGDGASAAGPALTAGVEPAQRPIVRPPDPPAAEAAPARTPPADGARQPASGGAAAGAAATSAPSPDPVREDVQRLVAEIFRTPSGTADRTAVGAAGPAAVAAAGHTVDAAPAGTTHPGRAAVWVPFHSRMSADCFAERLSESLDHPFRVERRGPGRYQVVFAYADESERQTLLEEASAVTGLQL